MPLDAALARKWIKFNEDGTRGDTRIESANIEVIPPMAITEIVDGDEIMETIPAHYVEDAVLGAVYVPEQTVGTGSYEKITKVVGQTPEQYASQIYADGTFEPFDLTGYVEVTHEEYLLYSGNSEDGKEYVRDAETGKPIEKPPYVPPLDEVKAAKIAALKDERDTAEVMPIEYNGHLYDYDDKARDRINAAIIALDLAGEGASLTWTCADNTDVAVTAADLRAIIAAVAVRSNTLHVAYREAKEKVEVAATKEELEAITLI